MVLQLTRKKTNPTGVLLVTISEIEEKTSKNGFKMVVMSYVIVDAPDQDDIRQTVKFQRFMLSNKGWVNRFLDFVEAATGYIVPENTKADLDLDLLLQQRVTVLLEEEEGDDGKKWLKTAKFWPEEEYAERVQEYATPVIDEEHPF